MPLLIVLFGILLLLVLILGLRLNAFLALVLAALVIGVMEGMPFAAAVKSIEKGVGDTLGSLTLIIGFGAMLGSLIVESGAAQKITFRLLNVFGEKRLPWAMVLTGFIIGVPLFYNAAFVLLVPVAFAIIKATGLPSLYVGIPMAAALSVTHGYLPPHPGPSAIAVIYKADFGLTLLYGIIVAIPAIIIAGPILGGFLKNYKVPPPKDLFGFKERTEAEMPGFGVSLFVALVPVLLMALSARGEPDAARRGAGKGFLRTDRQPGGGPAALGTGCHLAAGGAARPEHERGERDAGGRRHQHGHVLFTIGGGGALKGVIVDSGVGKYIEDW
jgi:Gnt-I system high-affinity gluconate transporter/Gnt-II system L-idonate transporter